MIRLTETTFFVVVWVLILGPISAAGSIGSKFTFQGQIKDDGMPINEASDFQFRLWNHVLGGSQIGAVVVRNGVPLKNGLFSVELDFGVDAFNGSDRWLEIAVRSPAGIGAFNTMSPRQPLTPTPYAVQTRGLFVDDARDVGVATTNPMTRLHVHKNLGGQNDAAAVFEMHNCGGACAQEDHSEGIRLLNSNGNGQVGIGFLVGGGSTIETVPDLWMGTGYGVNANDLMIATQSDDTTLTSRLSVDGARGDVVIGESPPWNPHGFGRVLNIQSDSNGPGNAAVVFSDSNGRAWSVGLTTGGALDFFKEGSGSNQVILPVLNIRGGSDIAEPFDVNGAEKVKPGMLVSIDPQSIGELRVSNRAYDSAVAGIVSGANGVNTGMTLSQTGSIADGEHPIALTGRVWCYCDADAGGPITAGDLLTTSNTPGHAMRVTDRARAAGATIGKAMSSLNEGKGLVLVLVSLQ